MSLFTPELLESFDSSILPQPEADTLPPVIYTSEEFLEFERGAIFDGSCRMGAVDWVEEEDGEAMTSIEAVEEVQAS
ncbi:MAG: aromatic ring-hydroxylating dioxygenase subunit alpha, partial [Myxococcota bacterium]|nr:aromatic ring-hydroxylating dioxygenase subunit alpha [Myxococcota bacterium]